jgi:hypothetical protein
MIELWYSPREVDFRLDCNIFLLHHYEELEVGTYPTRPSDYLDSGKGNRNTKAPFETPALIKAELDLRLGQCKYPHECWQLNRMLGKLIIAELSWKKLEWDELDREVKDGMLFISSGVRHRHITFSQYMREQRRQWKIRRLKELSKVG